MPKIIYANVSPRSVGGASMFDAGNRINAKTVANFFSDDQIDTRAVNRLRDAGFEILPSVADYDQHRWLQSDL